MWGKFSTHSYSLRRANRPTFALLCVTKPHHLRTDPPFCPFSGMYVVDRDWRATRARPGTCAFEEKVPRVRIPLAPPHSLKYREILPHCPNNRAKTPQFFQFLLPNRTGESALHNAAGKLCGYSLRMASEQSGFNDSIRRMQCDHKLMMRRSGLDFCPASKAHSLPTSPFERSRFAADAFACSEQA